MSDFLSFDAILAAPDSHEDVVDVPEWNGKVKVRSLTKAQQINVRKRATGKNGQIDDVKMEGGLLVAGVVEPPLKEYQVPELFAKSAGPLDRILSKIMELSGMDGLAQDQAAEDLEQTES